MTVATIVKILLGAVSILVLVCTVVYRLSRPLKCPSPFCPEIGKLVERGEKLVTKTTCSRHLTLICRFHGRYNVVEYLDEDWFSWPSDGMPISPENPAKI